MLISLELEKISKNGQSCSFQFFCTFTSENENALGLQILIGKQENITNLLSKCLNSFDFVIHTGIFNFMFHNFAFFRVPEVDSKHTVRLSRTEIFLFLGFKIHIEISQVWCMKN